MAWTEIGSLKGPKGDQGDTGPEGPQGPQGDPGKSVTIQGKVADAAALPTGLTEADTGKGWITDDDGHLHVWDGDSFSDVGQIEGPPGDEGPQGPAGRGITAAEVDGAYKLNITYSDSTSYQSASLRGPQGDPGEQGPAGDPGATGATGAAGRGISAASVDGSYRLNLTYTDATTFQSGSIRGAQGATGATGNGINSASVDGSYRLNLGFTDGTSYQSGSIRGPQGATGSTGSTGATGSRGASISAGAGVPGTVSGELVNDLYIDTQTGKIYKKTS